MIIEWMKWYIGHSSSNSRNRRQQSQWFKGNSVGRSQAIAWQQLGSRQAVVSRFLQCTHSRHFNLKKITTRHYTSQVLNHFLSSISVYVLMDTWTNMLPCGFLNILQSQLGRQTAKYSNNPPMCLPFPGSSSCHHVKASTRCDRIGASGKIYRTGRQKTGPNKCFKNTHFTRWIWIN